MNEVPWFIVGLAAEARLLRHHDGCVRVGGGTPDGARAAAREALRLGAPCLISFGLAGGLDPNLSAGSLVVPRTVTDSVTSFVADTRLTDCLGGATHQILLGAAAIVADAAEKARLWRTTGAVAVDLESGAVAAEAVAAGRPFAAFRVVCDPATRSLPSAACVPLLAGRVDLVRVLASVVWRPGQLASLLGLARDAAIARRVLRDKARQLSWTVELPAGSAYSRVSRAIRPSS